MKTSEILVQCLLAGCVGGVASAVVTGLMLEKGRAEPEPREAVAAAAPAGETADAAEIGASLDALRLSDDVFSERLNELESRLALAEVTREPVAAERPAEVERAPLPPGEAAALGADDSVLSPAFVASVDRALSEIRAREEREREARLEELQAQRLEERLADLQQDLGLSNYQVREMRGVLITMDDKRSALFESMREGDGDRRGIFEGMRTIREDTHAALKTILTPEQFEGYVGSEERDFRRRDFRDFGRERWPGGPPDSLPVAPPGGGR